MKFLIILLGIVTVTSSFADEVAGVAVRMTCAEINSMISELSAVEEPDTDTIDELTKLKADYRRSCSRAARGRKTSASSRVVVAEAVVTTEDELQTENDEKDVKAADVVLESQSESQPEDEEEVVGLEEEVVEEETVQGPTEEELLEQELANLDAGLCVDGTKPNKYGCCTDELFKDLGNTVFACCPKDGGDCFPPIK